MKYSRINHIAIGFSLLLLLLSTYPLRGQSASTASFYRIAIDGNNMTEVQVEWTCTPQDSLLFMAPGADQFPNRWGKFVDQLRAEDQTGQPLFVESLSDARWRIHTPLGQKVKLSYKVQLNHEDYKWSGGIDGIAYVKAWGVFCSGRSLFIMNGEPGALEVDFEVPDDWTISSAWQAQPQKHSFRVSNHHNLVNALFFAGQHEEILIRREDFELAFALGGPTIIAQKAAFVQLAEGVLDYYISLFGGIPIPPPGQTLQKALVIINPGAVTDGEVVGNDISILLESDGDDMAQLISRFIFAHEFFHLWNGKTFIPEQNDVEWFKEGFTNYYTLKSLHKVGVLTPKSYFDMIGQFFYARYQNDEGVGELAMTDGDLKHNHWGLIYAGGLFVAIIQDIQIRQASNNQKSLDDLMRQLYHKYKGSNERYTLDELQELLTTLNGKSQAHFFQDYIIGTQALPLIDYLNRIGLKAQMENEALTIKLPEHIPTSQQSIIEGLLGL